MSEHATSGFARVIEVIDEYSPLEFGLIFEHFDRFLYGVWVTLELTVLALIFGAIFSIPMAVARANKHWLFNGPIWLFTYVFRGTPLLVQTYLIYYGLGQFKAVQESVLWDPILSKAWWCAIIAFTLNTAAYQTELLRGTIESTPTGEVEAAKAVGMSARKRMRRIILPGAIRRAIPAYSNEVIFMLHGSVVASVITLQDILGVGRWLNGRYYLAYEGFITAAVLYMCLVFVISRGFRFWERKWLAHLRPRNELEAAARSKVPAIRI
jgi:arginine/ornithine transport system permease protein